MRKIVPMSGFKFDKESGSFVAYANTKGVIDHAKDRAIDGCYQKTIDRHKKSNSMPLMLWSHNPRGLPVGTWKSWKEDHKGLLMEGSTSKSTMGRDIEILANESALDSFSIGYDEIDSSWNNIDNCNDLKELDIHEVSWVNFACNEDSLLQEIKLHMLDGGLPSKSDIKDVLVECGFSNSHAYKISEKYDDSLIETQTDDIFDMMSKL